MRDEISWPGVLFSNGDEVLLHELPNGRPMTVSAGIGRDHRDSGGMTDYCDVVFRSLKDHIS
jgi:hypothetical protein